MPELADHLRSIDARSEARDNDLKAAVGDIVKQQQLQGVELLQQVAQAFSSAFRVGAEARALGAAAGGAAGGIGAAGGVGAAAGAVASTPAFPSLVPSLAPNPTDTNGPSAVTTAEGSPDILDPPCYRMCCSVKTVEALWHEWKVGLNGQPSISALNSKWGSR